MDQDRVFVAAKPFTKQSLLGWALACAVLCCQSAPAFAAFTTAPTAWTNFANNPGYTSAYTYRGQPISDQETSADITNGGSAVSPDRLDLASGSPGAFPGIYNTPFYGYYNGGTVYDPNTPSTMNDDYIYFKMRLEGNPSAGGSDFDQYHWNILLDVDADGYKEFWVDLNGAYGTGAYDQLQILYDNMNTQIISDPNVSRVAEFQARNDGAVNSHTRVTSTTSTISPGDTDYFIEFQVPLTAFKDLKGNQVLYPNSPVGFVFSTGASNQDPLQKDFMMDLKYINSNDPIQFGDTVKLNNEPVILFVDASSAQVSYYDADRNVYVYVKDRAANTNATTIETLTITVTDPTTGDDETLNLRESGPDTGVFTNLGGTSIPTTVSRSNFSAWVQGLVYLEASGSPGQLSWRVRFDGTSWIVESSPDGSTWTSRGAATPGTTFTYTDASGWGVSLALQLDNAKNANVGDTITFTSYPGDPLPSSTSAGGGDDNGTLLVNGGDTIKFSYTPSGSSTTYTTDAAIRAPCQALVQFTRSTGLPAGSYIITNGTTTSDKLYVTVTYPEGNTSTTTVQTISVRLAAWNSASSSEIAPPAGDLETALTLTETGVNTGVFRNSALDSRITDGTATANDALWEDLDGGALKALFSYSCNGAKSASGVARLFMTTGGGRVYFVNATGTADVSTYGSGQYLYLKVVDGTSSTCTYPGSATPATAGSVTVTLTTPVGDSKTVTISETSTGSGVYLFGANTYQTATYDGSYSTADNVLELSDGQTITATYTDTCDGDGDSGNNGKTDTGAYNAPSVVINEVLFYPSSATCQTEFVQIYNSSAAAVNVTGYQLSDGDSFSYTIPQFSGSDISLDSGTSVYVSLYPSTSTPAGKYDGTTGTYYLFAPVGATLPSDQLNDPGDPTTADRADQILLYNASSTIVDYVGWSANSSPSLDFLSDDSSAVSTAGWQDDAFVSVGPLGLGYSIKRSSAGYDTNQPGDWVISSSQSTSVCSYAITRAVIASFRAFEEAGRVVVEWQTAAETGTVGFYLLRVDPATGQFTPVVDGLLPGLLGSPQGGTYRVFDDEVSDGLRQTYQLLELESSGALNAYGPFTVTVARLAGAEAAQGGAKRSFYAREAHRQVKKAKGNPSKKTAQLSPGSQIRIDVGEDGLYSLATSRIAELSGLSAKEATKLVKSRQLQLTTRGVRVPYLTANDGSGLWFYGRRRESRYTAKNVYLLAAGTGTPVLQTAVAGAAPGAGEGATFLQKSHSETDKFASTALADDPEQDYWYWEYIFAGYSGADVRTFALGADGRVPQGTASLSVELQGATEDGFENRDHHAVVSLNKTPVGEIRWSGTASARETFAFDAALLNDGENVVEVRGLLDEEIPYSLFYIDSFDLKYPRAYRASADRLFFRGDQNAVVTVSGFTSSSLSLYDVSDPDRPALVSGATRGGVPGNYSLTFSPASAERRYLALAGPAVQEAQSSAFTPAGLASPANAADYLVITSRELRLPAQALADYRASQGLSSRVVLLDEIYGEFSFGIREPVAIHAFLDFAAHNWLRPPRYVVLAGDGTYDYKNLLEHGDNVVPPMLVATPDGLFASDNAYADFNGDGAPELAIGRLPATDAEELQALVDKIAAYEAAPADAWSRQVILAADAAVADGDFPADSAAAGTFIPPDYEIARISLDDLPFAQAHQNLIDALNRGAFLVNYVGHGGVDRLSQGGLLTTSDVPGLGNAERLPLFSAVTCVVANFSIPGYNCVGEGLTLSRAGGAVAVWAPTGLSESTAAARLNQDFFGRLFGGEPGRLGDIVVRALQDYRDGGHAPYLLKIYTLLGDPGLVLKQ